MLAIAKSCEMGRTEVAGCCVEIPQLPMQAISALFPVNFRVDTLEGLRPTANIFSGSETGGLAPYR
jgi:hypothetical protein